MSLFFDDPLAKKLHELNLSMSASILTDFDTLPTAFDVGLRAPLPLQSLPKEFPTSTVSPVHTWLRTSNVPELSSAFLYLERIGHVCFVSGNTVKIWKESGYDDPVSFTVDGPITAVATLDHPRVHQLVIFATRKQLHFVVVQPSLNGNMHFVPVKTIGPSLPTEIKVIKGYADGKALMGGEDGNVYFLKFYPKGTFVEDGFEIQVRSLTWEWKQLLTKPGVVCHIEIDEDRQMAYAIHAAGEIEALSLNAGTLTDRPSRVAIHRGLEDTVCISFAVLPKIGFGEATLMGMSAEGEIVAFALDRHLTDPGSEVTKRAKMWCGIGLRRNLRIVHRDNQLKDIFAEDIREGCTIKVLSVQQTTIIFALYSPNTGISHLWELRNGVEHRGLQQVQGIAIQGAIEGLSITKPGRYLMPLVGGMKPDGHELDLQYGRLSSELTIFTKEQRQRLTRHWPKDILTSILRQDDTTFLAVFMDLYGIEETAAMCMGLAARGIEAAEMLLLRNETLTAMVDKGAMLYFRRMTMSIWLAEVFTFKNEGSYLYPRHVLRAKLPSKTAKAWKDRVGQLKKYLMDFLKAADVDVYESRDVYVHSTSTISEEQAQKIVRFMSLPSTMKDCMAILEYLSNNTIAIEECKEIKDNGLLREIGFMMARDFVGFALDRSSELTTFLKEVKESLNQSGRHQLDRFFKSDVPSFDPSPTPHKEDALGETLTQRLRELRKKVRSMNEKLGRYTEEEIPDGELRRLELLEHHQSMFAMIATLNEELNEAETSTALETEILKLVQVVKEVDHEEMRHLALLHVIRSPLGGTPILCQDSIFETILKTELKIIDSYPYHQSLTNDQLYAVNRLREIYERTMRHEEAGCLYVVAATRKPDARLQGPRLDHRIRLLEKAQERFDLSQGHLNVRHTLHQLTMQREVTKMVREKYNGYEMEPEDEQMLMALDAAIFPPSQLKSLAEALLSGEDEETIAVFDNSEYGGVEELVDDIF